MDRKKYKEQVTLGNKVGAVIAALLTMPTQKHAQKSQAVAPEAPHNLRVQSAAEASFQAWAMGGTLDKHRPSGPKLGAYFISMSGEMVLMMEELDEKECDSHGKHGRQHYKDVRVGQRETIRRR